MKSPRRNPGRDVVAALVVGRAAGATDWADVNRLLRNMPGSLGKAVDQHFGINYRRKSFDEMVAQFNVPAERIERSVQIALEAVRSMAEARQRGSDGDASVRAVDVSLSIDLGRLWYNSWKIGLCPFCGWALPEPQKTGRPRKFCSDACRKAMSREWAKILAAYDEDDAPEVDPVVLSTTSGASRLLMHPITRRCWAEIDMAPAIPGLVSVVPLGQYDETIMARFRAAYHRVQRESAAHAAQAVVAYGPNWTISDLTGKADT